jgi:hypothetical protein
VFAFGIFAHSGIFSAHKYTKKWVENEVGTKNKEPKKQSLKRKTWTFS